MFNVVEAHGRFSEADTFLYLEQVTITLHTLLLALTALPRLHQALAVSPPMGLEPHDNNSLGGSKFERPIALVPPTLTPTPTPTPTLDPGWAGGAALDGLGAP